MSLIARFAAYAAAFEKAAASDDWGLLEPYFTEDAVYDTGATFFGPEQVDGRDAIFEGLDRVFNGFDRRFDTRELALAEGPVESEHSVWIRGNAIYRAAGVPEFVLQLEERVTFEAGGGDAARITSIEDRYTDTMIAETVAFLEKWGPSLGVTL